MSTPLQKKRLIHWLFLTLAVFCSLTAVYFFVQSKERLSAEPIALNDEITMQLSHVLTADNQAEPKVPLTIKLLSKLPDPVEKVFRKILKVPSASNSSTRYALSPTSAMAIFDFKYPRQWRNEMSVDEIANLKIRPALKAAGMKFFRSKFGSGDFSGAMQVHASTRSIGGSEEDVYVAAQLLGIPLNVRQIGIQFMADIANEDIANARTVEFENPLYKEITPIDNLQEMPVSTTHENVTVTLNNLVTKSVENFQRNSVDGESGTDLLKRNKFLRASGTNIDPYRSAVTYSIADQTSESNWKIRDLNVQYGKQLVNFDQIEMYEWHNSGEHGVEPTAVAILSRDVGVLGQPVKLSLSLVRDKNFTQDEIQQLDIPVPTTGTVAGPVTSGKFWNGTVEVYASSGKQIPELIHAPVRSGTISLVITNASDSVAIQKAVLLADDGTSADITGFASVPSRGGKTSLTSIAGTDHTMSLWYAFKNRGPHAPIDHTRYTTLSLTVVSPRKIRKPFSFIVRPEEATIPAVPVE